MSKPQFTFNCAVCKRVIDVGSSELVRVLRKEPTVGSAFSNFETYYIETMCVPSEIHVNIVVIDEQGKYRGHKHSTVKSIETIDEELAGKLRTVLNFGGNLSRVLTITLCGEPLVICGEEEACNAWSDVLAHFFTISPYETTEWLSLIREVIEHYGTKSKLNYGKIVLLDTGLINQALKIFEGIPVVELRRRTVHRSKDCEFSKNLVKTLLSIPASNSKVLATLINTQITELKSLLADLILQLKAKISNIVLIEEKDASLASIVESLMRRLLPPESYKSLTDRMKHEELVILAPHVVHAIEPLAKALDQRLQ